MRSRGRSVVSLAAFVLLGLFSQMVFAGTSADTAKMLSGNVLFYVVFVNDRGETQWSTQGIEDVKTKVREAADHLEAWASESSVPLAIQTTSAQVWTSYDVRTDDEQIWIRDAFQNTNAFNNPDGDEYNSDEVSLWLQDLYGRDNQTGQCRPTSVVIVFDIAGDAPSGQGPASVAEVSQETNGSYFHIYDSGNCGEFGYSWKAYAHEFLHAFGACDEYPYQGQCCVCENPYQLYGYGEVSPLGQTNPNCTNCYYGNSLDCLMKECGPNPTLCSYTRRQIGWGDADQDGTLDVLDTQGDLQSATVTSVNDFSHSEVAGNFNIIDLAGGELRMVHRADTVTSWDPQGEPLPHPLIGSSHLFSSGHWLYFHAPNYVDEFGQWQYSPEILSATFEESNVTGPWQVAGVVPSVRTTNDMVSGDGYMYCMYSDPEWPYTLGLLQAARIQDDGALGPWFQVTATHGWAQYLTVESGYLYAFGKIINGPFGPPDPLLVSAAKINLDGTIGSWDRPDTIGTESQDSAYETAARIVGSCNSLYVIGGQRGGYLTPRKTWSIRLRRDGTREQSHQGPDVPTWMGNCTLIPAGGCLFALGGVSSGVGVNKLFRSVLTDTMQAWEEVGTLPFSGWGIGATVTQNTNSTFLWLCGGSDSIYNNPTPNGLQVGEIEETQDLPYCSVATFRVSFAAQKNVRLIGLQSTKPGSTYLRYRIADDNGVFGDWSDSLSEQSGRFDFPEPGTPATAIDLQASLSAFADIHDLSVVYTDPDPGLTPVGNGILVTLSTSIGQCRFGTVTQSGTTTAQSVINPPVPPAGLVNRGSFELATDAVYDGEVEVGLQYDPRVIGSEAKLSLRHWDNGQWMDVTRFIDPIGRQIWGQAASFSVFGVFEDTLNTVAGAEETTSHAPHTMLSRPFPNPFNPTTTIKFSLASRGRTQLSVYDASGRLVAQPLDEVLEAGDHTFVWDGRSDQHKALTSGVYFCRLRFGSTALSERLVLLK